MFINKSSILKGLICGTIIGCFINLSVILSLYINLPTYIYYVFAFISTIITFIFFLNVKVTSLIISFCFAIITFVVTELIIGQIGVINMAFKQIHGATEEMWAGDGFGILVIYIYNLAGCFIGSILAFAITIINKFKRENII